MTKDRNLETEKNVSRRESLFWFAAGASALVSGCASEAQAAAPPKVPTANPTPPAKTPAAPVVTAPAASSGHELALSGRHIVVPLPFDATKLNGLSERMMTSHHDNNYAGAVKNLNKVEQEIAGIGKDTPAFVIGGLHQSELGFRNSVSLHEAYFANLGGNGRASGGIEAALAKAHGSFGRWEEHFRGIGASLGGGSGWVVLWMELLTGDLRTTSSNHHTQSLTGAMPLLVMDMYEHAYQMDYGAAAAKYIDAFFQNVLWEEVNKRFERANRVVGMLKGG